MGGKRRKIATNQRRETREQRAVSFTKRRQGLYNKAAELCLFYGAEVGIVVSSPSSVKNLYSFGHSSVDAVFDAFVEGCLPEDNAPLAEAVSLYEEVKAPEDERRKRKRDDDIPSDEFWREIEVLEERCESVEELEALVDNLEKFKDEALNRLATSVWSNLSNSDDDYNFACIHENHVDENWAFPDSDIINFDENNVLDLDDVAEPQAGCGMVADSVSHTLDSFTADDEWYNEKVFSCVLDLNPHQVKHSTCDSVAEAVTVSEFGSLISWADQLISYDGDQPIYTH